LKLEVKLTLSFNACTQIEKSTQSIVSVYCLARSPTPHSTTRASFIDFHTQMHQNFE